MSVEKLVIRRATENDAAILSKMAARMFRDAFGPDNQPEDMESYIEKNFSPANIKAELRDPATIFLLGYREEKLIGYAKLQDGKRPASVTGPAPIELARIYVDQTKYGEGYGSALMKACLEEAEEAGYGIVWLGVWEENESAIRFYESWGFRFVGTKRFVLGNDIQNDRVMARSVEPDA